MRHALGLMTLLLALAGCADEDQAGATDPAPPDTVLVSGTAAGGKPAERWTVLADDAAVAAYAEQFRGELAGDVTEAAGKVAVGEDDVLVAQVVSIGCDVPPGVAVGEGRLVAGKVASPSEECLAPVTTVALAAAPD